MLFQPNREQVRQFFFMAWQKHLHQDPSQLSTALEHMAVDIILLHPEYQTLLSGHPEAIENFEAQHPEATPFLHLSLHLAILEQLSIDQPKGITQCFHNLCKTHDQHDAYHQLIECLMMVMSEAQGTMPDPERYMALLQQLR